MLTSRLIFSCARFNSFVICFLSSFAAVRAVCCSLTRVSAKRSNFRVSASSPGDEATVNRDDDIPGLFLVVIMPVTVMTKALDEDPNV